MQNELNKTAVKNNLKRIFGTDFKVREFDKGFKVNVPTIDVTQMGELKSLFEDSPVVGDIKAKRSGTGITVIVFMNE